VKQSAKIWVNFRAYHSEEGPDALDDLNLLNWPRRTFARGDTDPQFGVTHPKNGWIGTIEASNWPEAHGSLVRLLGELSVTADELEVLRRRAWRFDITVWIASSKTTAVGLDIDALRLLAQLNLPVEFTLSSPHAGGAGL